MSRLRTQAAIDVGVAETTGVRATTNRYRTGALGGSAGGGLQEDFAGGNGQQPAFGRCLTRTLVSGGEPEDPPRKMKQKQWPLG